MTIIETVAERFAVPVDEILSRSRKIPVAHARQVAMYLLWIGSDKTLQDIGLALGHRCPATVTHGCQRIARLVRDDSEFRDEIKSIRKEE